MRKSALLLALCILGATDPPFVSTKSAVSFDGSFESGWSREMEVTGPKAVVSYQWDFGDAVAPRKV